MSYTTFLQTLAPTWLAGTLGSAWTGTFGDYLNTMVSLTKESTKVRMVAYAPTDALDAIGWERILVRGPTESHALYRARLLGAWDAWEWSGTKLGIMYGLAVAGWNASTWDPDSTAWPSVTWPKDGDVWIWDANEWTPPARSWDGSSDTYFWILLDGYNKGWTVSGAIGAPSLPIIGDDTWCIGFATSAQTFSILRTMVHQWKAAHSFPASAFVVMSSGHWDDVLGAGWRVGDSGWTVGGTVLEVVL